MRATEQLELNVIYATSLDRISSVCQQVFVHAADKWIRSIAPKCAYNAVIHSLD